MARITLPSPLPEIVKCTDTKCSEGLHCFRVIRKKPRIPLIGGSCHSCNAEIVDWDLVYARDIDNVHMLQKFLNQEYVRNVFWNVPLIKKVKIYTLENGFTGMEKKIQKRLETKLPPKMSNPYDGRQTSMEKHDIINFAQHATATCCRSCIKYWHDIPVDKTLSSSELDYLRSVAMNYVQTRVPNVVNSLNQMPIFSS
jgi:hypothetical protein